MSNATIDVTIARNELAHNIQSDDDYVSAHDERIDELVGMYEQMVNEGLAAEFPGYGINVTVERSARSSVSVHDGEPGDEDAAERRIQEIWLQWCGKFPGILVE